MLLIRIISITLILLAHLTTCAQEIQRVRITKYTQNDGLSSDAITKIIRDQYGFMWVGTQEGLNVFDGKSFQVFSKQSAEKQNIGGSYILDLVEDVQNDLIWVQSSFAPVSGIDIKSRTITQIIPHDDENKPYTETWARCLSLRRDQLWIGGANTISVWHIPTQSFLDIPLIKSSLKAQGEYVVSKVTHDEFGNSWLLLEGQGIMIFDDEQAHIKTFSVDELNITQNKEDLLFWDVKSTQGQIIIATSWGVLNFKTGNLSEDIKIGEIANSNLKNKPVFSLDINSDSLLLLATNNSLYIQNINSRQFRVLNDQQRSNNILNNIYQIYHNTNSTITWLGSRSGLMSFSLAKEPFEAISNSSSNDLTLDHINSILTKDGLSIYAVGPNGLYIIDTKSKNIELLDSEIYSWLIFFGPEEHIYVSGKKEIKVFDNKQRIPDKQHLDIPNEIQGYLLNSIIYYNDSLRLLGSYDNGLNIWNINNGQVTRFPNESVERQNPGMIHMSNLFKSINSKEVYILTGDAIVQFNPENYKYDIKYIKNPMSGLPLSNFMDMNFVGNSYFFATYGEGLIETDNEFNIKKIYTITDGLSNNCIYKIFNIKEEKVLLSTNNGISILDLKSRNINSYFSGDGLHGNVFEQFSGYQKDNKVYVGGPGGFTIVNTDLLPDSSVAPILYPTGITINTPDGKIDSTYLEMSSFTIPNNAFKTTLNFVSPDYKNPDRMKYRYKIDELSKKWVNLGNQNFVDLIGVNPGKYHFEVIATNSEGTDSEPLKMTLDFLPKWYQTTWFKILLLLLVAGLVYMVQRYRMIQLQKQQLIRKEIANDLHDDIGSTLNSLKIFAHLAQSDSNNKGHIEQIEESVSEATVGLRDMIWVLEDEQDSVYEIMERVKKFASPICMAHNIELICEVKATSDKAIPKKIKRNLFLVAKECINNSVKYAECTQIKVLIEYNKANLKLTASDNGKGFDRDHITKGKGLDSMQYRASQVQFDCQVISNPGNGTVTEFAGMIS